DDRRPNVPWHRSVIYEVQTKGFTARHPDVPKKLRGTYAGLATKPAIEHFKSLGVTAVELLPIHAFIDEGTLLGRKLTNYWRYNRDYTGCGNSLNVRHPQVLKLIMDSLRYWVQELHVDGFRFDLASALARELHEVDRLSAFFDIIHQDPIISQVKLIAEPWDVGEGGYQVGNFPVLWAEWNGRYRDTVRRYWKSDEGQLSDLAYRLTGSSDLYERNGRRPSASINFVTAHDGFTLHDLVSYNEKHNE